MEQIKRDLLGMIQKEFPIDHRPFAVVGSKLGISEEECIRLCKELTKEGVLREIRPVMNWKAAGFQSMLIGLTVENDKIETVAEVINEIPGVTHNYQREGILNLWCTLTCEPDETVRYLTFIGALDGVCHVKLFYSEKTYKIGLILDV